MNHKLKPYTLYPQPSTAQVSSTALGLASPPMGLEAVAGSAREVLLTWGVPRDTGDGLAGTAALVAEYAVEVPLS